MKRQEHAASTQQKSESLFDSTTGSSPPREFTLFFDHCIFNSIKELIIPVVAGLKHKARLILLREHFAVDTLDDVWAAGCKKRGWLIVTRDRSQTNNGPKLKAVCRDLGISHVLISSKAGANGTEQARAILAVWDELYVAWSTPQPSQYTICKTNDGLRFRLQSRPIAKP